MNKHSLHIEETNYNSSKELMTIIKYNDSRHVLVRFENGYEKWTTYGNFANGVLKNDSRPTVYGKGHIDIRGITERYPQEYIYWSSMLRRCFAEKWKTKHPAYRDTTCSEEWLCFSAFVKWCHEQSNWDYLINSDIRFELDKDIIIKHNKHYSSDTCCFIPQNINKLFTKHDKDRGMYPIGVNYNKKGDCYEAYCMDNKRNRISKYGFSNPIDAFNYYKELKEQVIKQVAEEEFTKGSITEKCYQAMIDYKVEIDD